MRSRKNFFLALLLVAGLAGAVSAQAQTQTADQTQPQAGSSSMPVTTVDQAIDRVIAREHDEMATIRRFTPLIETYIQDMKPDRDMGAIPVKDHYYLGQAELAKGVVDNNMLTGAKKGKLAELNPISHLSGAFSSSYVPEGFLQMIYIDTNGFDRQHYQFDYVRREFLGEVRCLVFDITPLPKSGRGRFKGRFWVEDQNYTIVRFNGIYTPLAGLNGFNIHFDSWRLNVQPGLWLPSYIYSQENDLKDFMGGHIRFKAQSRLWGYNLRGFGRQEEFSELIVESPSIQDQAAASQDRSPIEAEREWQHQAEVNVIDRLQRIGLLAMPGEVDKVLETVVNNLEVTNSLDIQPEIHCRVLLTGTVEMFTIGHTIVLSRGLLDVLPDEASLATMLAQEMADIIVTKPSTDQWGFNDMTNVTTTEALGHFTFKDSPEQVQLAGEKAVELLKNSPYKDKLGTAGLFLKQLDTSSKSLNSLINPRLGNRVYLASQLMSSAPELKPGKVDQISALPIGARIKLDPWSDHVELVKSKPVPLYSAREKMPFEVTPFMPFLTRYQKPGAATNAADPSKADLAKKQQQPAQQHQ
jgi:hypothetical protein